MARCLAKDRQQRQHDIGDARLEIDEVLASPTAIVPAVGNPAPRHIESTGGGSARCMMAEIHLPVLS